MKLISVFCLVALFAGGLNASADWGRPGPGYGGPGRPGYGGPGRPGYGGPGHGGPGYGRPPMPPRAQWLWSGQKPGPAGGSPWGVSYCGTESPGGPCYQRGAECYVQNGYWWDSSRGQNMFNVFQCR